MELCINDRVIALDVAGTPLVVGATTVTTGSVATAAGLGTATVAGGAVIAVAGTSTAFGYGIGSIPIGSQTIHQHLGNGIYYVSAGIYNKGAAVWNWATN